MHVCKQYFLLERCYYSFCSRIPCIFLRVQQSSGLQIWLHLCCQGSRCWEPPNHHSHWKDKIGGANQKWVARRKGVRSGGAKHDWAEMPRGSGEKGQVSMSHLLSWRACFLKHIVTTREWELIWPGVYPPQLTVPTCSLMPHDFLL